MATTKYRVHAILSIVVNAPDAERAKHLAYRELEQVVENELRFRLTLKVVSVLNAELKEDRR